MIWDSLNGTRALQDVAQAQGVDLHGFKLTHASGVSADGKSFAGWGTNPSGPWKRGFCGSLDARAKRASFDSAVIDDAMLGGPYGLLIGDAFSYTATHCQTVRGRCTRVPKLRA